MLDFMVSMKVDIVRAGGVVGNGDVGVCSILVAWISGIEMWILKTQGRSRRDCRLF